MVSGGPASPPAAPVLDLFGHANCAHQKPNLQVRMTTARGRAIEVAGEVVLDLDFCTLRRFARATARRRPEVVLAAPLSGHFAALLQDTLAALVCDHDVYLTEWKDAATVPSEAGPFDLDDVIHYLIQFLHAVGRRAHVVGMSQSGVPIVATASLMAAGDDAMRPRSMTLMGGLIDTRINPTGMNRLARAMFCDAQLARISEWALIRPVPAPYPGAGRPVYPAWTQLAGLALYLLRRLSPEAPTPLDVFQRMLIGDGVDPASRRISYDVFLTLMDLPAELYLQTMRVLFAEDALPRGDLIWHGRRVQPAAIRDIALMTVEAERDDISGMGQTRVAQELCCNIPDRLRRHHFEPGIGHLGMFLGRYWRSRILPMLREFVRGLEEQRTGR